MFSFFHTTVSVSMESPGSSACSTMKAIVATQLHLRNRQLDDAETLYNVGRVIHLHIVSSSFF